MRKLPARPALQLGPDRHIPSLGPRTGGSEPVWSREGRELVYRRGTKMMAVGVKTQPRFTAGPPQLLFERRFDREPCCGLNYDVTPDGEHFVMIQQEGLSELSQIHVITNWVEELKRLVPDN